MIWDQVFKPSWVKKMMWGLGLGGWYVILAEGGLELRGISVDIKRREKTNWINPGWNNSDLNYKLSYCQCVHCSLYFVIVLVSVVPKRTVVCNWCLDKSFRAKSDPLELNVWAVIFMYKLKKTGDWRFNGSFAVSCGSNLSSHELHSSNFTCVCFCLPDVAATCRVNDCLLFSFPGFCIRKKIQQT